MLKKSTFYVFLIIEEIFKVFSYLEYPFFLFQYDINTFYNLYNDHWALIPMSLAASTKWNTPFKGANWIIHRILVQYQIVHLSNIAIAILDFSHLLPIKLSLFQLL